MIRQVYRVGFTVSDLDPVLAFYTQVLPFEIIDDCVAPRFIEGAGEPYEKLTGVFGARVRVVTLGLGQEQIQLTQFIAPPSGRPIPPDSRSNDLWFQHLAIVVSDMDTAYATLREHNVQHVSTAPQPRFIEGASEPYEKLTGVFGARVRVVTLELGQEQIQLTQFIAPPGGRPISPDSRSNDLWFQHLAIVVSDMDTAYATLREHNVQHVSTAPQTLPDYITAAAGIRAFYCRDPDGHNLELIWFPEGKGSPRWQSKNRLFLGIDHTAIGIAHTEHSLRFYRDILGLTIAGESENYGMEQEHLNTVFGAHLQITGLPRWRHGH